MDITSIASHVARGDRRALARAITLVESAREDHRAQAEALLAQLVPVAAAREVLRLGLTGAPGVGKSSFIEALGLHLVSQGLSVAVLAIDPSSQLGGGAVLGDKTRMERLGRAKNAFIRPSPSGAQAGGVARRSVEVLTLCEAAGFDVILLETVGTGQSETAAANMVDVFALLVAPAGGDELQGVKRGVMEHADLILVTKADGDLHAQALATRGDYANALRLLPPRAGDPPGYPRALAISARENAGIAEAWEAISTLAQWRRNHGITPARRESQARAAFRAEVESILLARLGRDRALAARLAAFEEDVARGRLSAAAAARQALHDILPGGDR